MNQNFKARVVEKILNKYILKLEDERYIEAITSGNIKKNNKIIVGDFVDVEEQYNTLVITNVSERTNCLIRPPVSNIDQLLIVVSLTNPKPDYILLDKQIALCRTLNIEPILCINKIDLSKDNDELKKELKYIAKTYTNLVENIIYVSTVDEIGINELKVILKGKTSAFSGNSGVGKSSITSLIINKVNKEKLENIEIGNIGEKSGRGKHTTKYVKLYSIDNNTYLLDTPGFSSFELYDILYKDLKKYYAEFKDFTCEFEDCNHINEKEDVCAIKQALNKGLIDQGRYDRYVYIYSKLKELDYKKYK